MLDSCLEIDPRFLGDSVHILIAAPREIHEQNLRFRQSRAYFRGVSERMTRLERGDDSFEPTEVVKSLQRFIIRYRDVFRASVILQPGVFGPHTGIIEARRNRMRFDDLAVVICKGMCGCRAIPWTSRGQRCGMFSPSSP